MSDSNPEIKKKLLVIDTQVTQAAGDKYKPRSEAIIKCFQDLVKEGYTLASSEYSLYESLHGLWGNQAVAVASLYSSYELKVVDRKILIVASIFGGLYHDEKHDGISDGDKIIGSTALIEKGYILTENHKDFPPPFFTLVKYIPVIFNKGVVKKTMDLGLYEPHYELINRRVDEKEKLFF
jgi:predicted nucleic acid-binding protein